LRRKALTPKRLQARAQKLDAELRELTALWNKAAQDELAIRPGERCIADLLMLSCDHYANLVALRKTYSLQLRQFQGLCKDAEHARRPPADEAGLHPVLGKRPWSEGGSDSGISAATTPRSTASTPTGRTPSWLHPGPPEDDEIPADERELERGELDGELGIAAEIDSVPSHLRGNRPAAAARGAGIESQRNGVAACR
jgi:hypothetical protein